MIKTTFKSLQKKTVTAGTAVPLVATPTWATNVVIKGLAANTGAVYVGGSTVSATTGFQLAAAAERAIGPSSAPTIVDLSQIYVDSATNAEGVTVSYLEVQP